MNPSFLKRFIKKLTRDLVVPIISAKTSWLILGTTVSGLQWLAGVTPTNHPYRRISTVSEGLCFKGS